ncbi:MAG: TAXI family TRAP transporter solute-binding subunit, partial [Alphaproteobacteria bacterium]
LFANKNWGPSPLLNLFNNIGRNGIGLAIANDIGVKTAADLKGKRVAWVKGAPALNVNAQAVLAFGGLTWDDVEKVEVPGWGQSMQAIIDGQLDAAAGSTISGVYPQIAASPRGLYHHDLPHSDEAGWRRLQAVAPYWSKLAISAAVNGENNPTGKMPYEGGGYPYPTFISMPDATDDLAYGLVKAVMENYEDFKDAGPGMDGYQLANQNLAWVFPYHPGAIAYFMEVGEWGAEEQSHNDGLLKRQDVLMKAWEAFRAKGDVADAAFEEAWLKARAEALEAAGMPAPFSEPL